MSVRKIAIILTAFAVTLGGIIASILTAVAPVVDGMHYFG